MPSVREQRRIERLLDQADEAADARKDQRVLELAEDIPAFDPEKTDAAAYVEAAQGRPASMDR